MLDRHRWPLSRHQRFLTIFGTGIVASSAAMVDGRPGSWVHSSHQESTFLVKGPDLKSQGPGVPRCRATGRAALLPAAACACPICAAICAPATRADVVYICFLRHVRRDGYGGGCIQRGPGRHRNRTVRGASAGFQGQSRPPGAVLPRAGHPHSLRRTPRGAGALECLQHDRHGLDRAGQV